MTKKNLLILFILFVLPITYLQAQTYDHTANNKIWRYTVNGGNATIISAKNLDNSLPTGEINIPAKVGTSPEYNVTAIGAHAFYKYKKITKLTANSVTTIGDGAFYECSGLAGKLELPNATTIGREAFYYCTGLAGKLEIPNVTTIGNSAFYRCAGLTGKLEIPNVTTIGEYAFYRCAGLTGKLELPNVTTLGNSAFSTCTGLTGLELPKVTTIGYGALSNCTGLTGKLELPNATTIGDYAFLKCSGLTGKLELPKVTKIGAYTFNRCSGLTSLELTNVTTINVNAFELCTGLTGNLELPNVTTIGQFAFQDCTGLTGKLELPNLTSIGNQAFQNCSGLTGLELPKVTNIGQRAFYQCTGLTGKLELPKTLTSIGTYAFSYCNNLSAVKFESGTNLTNADEGLFENCYRLQYIDMTGVTLPSGLIVNRHSGTFLNTNYYTMVYLPATAPAAQSGHVNFVIGNKCDKLVVYDNNPNYGNMGCDYPIQHPFTATIATYENRVFSGLPCKTVCLPYKATLPTGMRAYKLVAKTGGGARFRFVSVGDGNGTFQLDANTPYLVRVINGSILYDLYTTNNAQVLVTPTTMEVALADGQTFFGGITTNIDNATAAGGNYYNLSNNTWYPIKTTDTNGYVHSFRAYIRTTGGTPAKGFAMVIDDDENATTDIDNAAELTEDELRSGKHTFYTIDGRRAGTNYDTLKSGEMYVVKGQKFYKF